MKGYELRFYRDGTVIFTRGPMVEKSSNIMMDGTPELTASGTWSNIGDSRYLVKVNPTGLSGAPTIWEYTYVPAYTDHSNGKQVPEHIESQDERDAIPKGRNPFPDEMFFPERAKTD
jgi:hypothetical protein